MRNRRAFLKSASTVATSFLCLSFIPEKKNKIEKEPAIGCAPDMPGATPGGVISIKSGPWSDPTTWNGRLPTATDTAVIAEGHNVVLDLPNIEIAGVIVYGTLRFRPTRSVTLLSGKNIIVYGVLVMQPDTLNIIHLIKFIGIDESNFVGGGMSVLDSDIGLWVMDAGKLVLMGTPKTSWTNAESGVQQGATSIPVSDATGWQVGDEIVIVPTEQPGFYTQDWVDTTGTLVDSFFDKFETRVISKIRGNNISFLQPLQYDHLAVASNVISQKNVITTKKWFPEVANLTRNVRIEGSKDSGDSYTAYRRSHIFIHSSVPQKIKYMQGKYLGPRKLQGKSRPDLITGRYAIHFHHCQDGSRGSLVEGCVLNDIGNRCYVPHVSNGVTMKNNIAFNALEEAFWWDWQDISHSTVLQGNLMAAIRLNGTSNSCTGMALGEGDDNIARNNVAVYANGGVAHNGGGAFSWLTNSEGVWIFENNMAHSCITGIFVWQNSSHNHTVHNYCSYNCYEGIEHGAYGNCYIYTGGFHFNSNIFVEATSGNTYGTVFKNIICDASGNDYCVRVVDSPIPSNPAATNKFIACTFRNYGIAPLQLASELPNSNIQKQFKQVDLINCDFPSGNGYVMDDNNLYSLNDNSRIRVLPLSGQAIQTFKSGGTYITSNILPFTSHIWAGGAGLTGEYYNGANFDSLAFKRVDSMIMFQQWTYDAALSPNGIHHLITGDSYSIRWTGAVMAQYSETHTFFLQGSGGYRLWVNGNLILDSWFEKPDNSTTYPSSKMDLLKGQKYDIKLEHFNTNGKRGCLLYWECASMGIMSNIPQCQLFSTSAAKDIKSLNSTNKSEIIAESAIGLQVNTFPNPFTSNFHVQIKSGDDSPVTLVIYDVKGSQVGLYQNVSANSTLTTGDRLQKGTYFLSVVQNNSKKNITLLKM